MALWHPNGGKLCEQIVVLRQRPGLFVGTRYYSKRVDNMWQSQQSKSGSVHALSVGKDPRVGELRRFTWFFSFHRQLWHVILHSPWCSLEQSVKKKLRYLGWEGSCRLIGVDISVFGIKGGKSYVYLMHYYSCREEKVSNIQTMVLLYDLVKFI